MNIIRVAVMQKERDPLGLSSLPPVDPPADDWPVIRAALEADSGLPGRRHHGRWLGALLATAALVTLAVGIGLRMEPAPAPVKEAERAETQLADSTVPAASEKDILNSLVSLSQQLEGQLQAHRQRTGSTRTGTLAYQVELEDLVALVDEELSRDPESLELWSQRVNLLLDINQLYKNQLRRDYQNMASL